MSRNAILALSTASRSASVSVNGVSVQYRVTVPVTYGQGCDRSRSISPAAASNWSRLTSKSPRRLSITANVFDVPSADIPSVYPESAD